MSFWIESHQSLARHRKTLKVVAILKVDRHKLIGHLHELWWWALDNADIYGLLPECSRGEIAEAAGWPIKQAEEFVAALIGAGFIEASDDGSSLRLHDWYEYAGKLNEKRASNRERMKGKRERAPAPDDQHRNGTRAEHVQHTSGAQPVHVQDMSGACAPPTGPNQPDSTGRTPQPPSPGGRDSRRRKPAAETVMVWPTGVQPGSESLANGT